MTKRDFMGHPWDRKKARITADRTRGDLMAAPNIEGKRLELYNVWRAFLGEYDLSTQQVADAMNVALSGGRDENRHTDSPKGKGVITGANNVLRSPAREIPSFFKQITAYQDTFFDACASANGTVIPKEKRDALVEAINEAIDEHEVKKANGVCRSETARGR